PGLYKVAANGGNPSLASTLDSSRREIYYAWPQFLPDGRRFLYFVASGRAEYAGIYLGSVNSAKTRHLINISGNAVYAESPAGRGYLLFYARDYPDGPTARRE